jgi:hypothetical protein
LALAPDWRLEAAITGTLGSVPLHRGSRHLCLPVSAASSRVIRWLWCGCPDATPPGTISKKKLRWQRQIHTLFETCNRPSRPETGRRSWPLKK